MSTPSKTENIHQKPNPLWLWAGAPVLLTLLFYFPALGNGFLNWDDQEVILNNPHIRSMTLSNLYWMLTDLKTGNWEPLTWFSFYLDHLWGGLQPLAYHLDNILLNGINTLLVFFLSKRLLGRVTRLPGSSFPKAGILPAASLTAALFGLHPLHVESVAWATERKDLLCGLFCLLSLLSYLSYAAGEEKRPQKYVASLMFFLLALMSKPMAVTLPAVLLLLDLWPLKRFWPQSSRSLREKIPFFLLALILSATTISAQSKIGAMASLDHLGIPYRLMNSLHNLWFYLLKTVWPIHLTAFYPLPPETQVFSPEYIVAGLGILALCLFLYAYRQKRPYLGTAWLYYLVTIAPVVGFLQYGTQTTADRYAYLPTFGFLLLFSAWVVFHFSRRPTMGVLFGSLLVLALGWGTFQQLGAWKSQVDLWEKVVRDYPGVNGVAYCNLGNAYQATGRLEEALKAYDEAVKLDPSRGVAHEGRGFILSGLGKTDEAFGEFQRAVELEPNQPIYLLTLGNAYLTRGKVKEAIGTLEAAEKIQPQNPALLHQLSLAYEKKGEKKLAMETQARALSLVGVAPGETPPL